MRNLKSVTPPSVSESPGGFPTQMAALRVSNFLKIRKSDSRHLFKFFTH